MTYTETLPEKGRTIAVDPKLIPLGSEVMIDGIIYIAEDVGNLIQGNRIDLFVGTEEDAIAYGKQYYEVFIKKNKNE